MNCGMEETFMRSRKLSVGNTSPFTLRIKRRTLITFWSFSLAQISSSDFPRRSGEKITHCTLFRFTCGVMVTGDPSTNLVMVWSLEKCCWFRVFNNNFFPLSSFLPDSGKLHSSVILMVSPMVHRSRQETVTAV